MPVKCIGQDFKAWFSDWGGKPGDEAYWDDVWVTINGEGTDDPDVATLADDAVVEIQTGTIFSSYDRESDTDSALTHYRRWLKKRNTATILVAVPKDKEAEVRDLLKKVEGVTIV